MKSILMDYMKKFTTLDDEAMNEIVKNIPVQMFKKGTVLIEQGDVPKYCYFVLKGCIRQYAVDEEGKESTYNFFTEEQSVTIFNQHLEDKTSKFSLSCTEESVLVVGDLETEQDMYDKHNQLATMTRKMIEMSIGETHETFATFMASSPEDRYRFILKTRPNLVDRVPQHQLASYLGITPESLSRIKKRVYEIKPSI